MLDRAGRLATGIIFALAKLVLALSATRNQRFSVVKKAVDLDVHAFARRTAMAGAGSKERARFLFALRFDTPFLDPRHQHPGVE
jgi:hypothetical protein